jgi:hypothetical protein
MWTDWVYVLRRFVGSLSTSLRCFYQLWVRQSSSNMVKLIKDVLIEICSEGYFLVIDG